MPKPEEITVKAAPMKDTPVKAVPMKGISAKSLPYRRATSVTALPEVPGVIPKEDREWQFISWVKYASDRPLNISTRMVERLRHAPHLRESDGAISLENHDARIQWLR